MLGGGLGFFRFNCVFPGHPVFSWGRTQEASGLWYPCYSKMLGLGGYFQSQLPWSARQ